MKSQKLIIVGLSNNAKLAAFYFSKDTSFEVVGFAVDSQYKVNSTFCDLPVFDLEQINTEFPPTEFSVFVAVGYKEMNDIRAKLYERMKALGYTLPNYISPKCTFQTTEAIGDNNFILEDNTIQPFVKIGNNNVLWSGNHIGHDVEIGDHNFIASHVVVSGFTKIENYTFIGVNATLRDNILIRSKSLIGAGAIVTFDTNEGEVHLPARSSVYHKKSNELSI